MMILLSHDHCEHGIDILP